MLHFSYTGVALFLSLLASALPALIHREHREYLRGEWANPLRLLLGLMTETSGVVVVTYCSSILGAPTTTAPTGAQASQIPEISAQVFFADADTAAVIVHNWGTAASSPAFLNPQVFFNKSLGGASDSSFATNFTFGLTNTNSVTMVKNSVGTGSGGTYNVYLRRPHSIGR
jgi:hypothetical protein